MPPIRPSARRKVMKPRGKPPTTEIGAFIQRVRLARGYTQQELSAALGCSAKYIHKLEHGERDVPQTVLLCRMAVVLEVPLSELLVRNGLVPRCDDPELLDVAPQALAAWRVNLLLRDSAHMAREVMDILVRNKHRIASDLHELLTTLTKHVSAIDIELRG